MGLSHNFNNRYLWFFLVVNLIGIASTATIAEQLASIIENVNLLSDAVARNRLSGMELANEQRNATEKSAANVQRQISSLSRQLNDKLEIITRRQNENFARLSQQITDIAGIVSRTTNSANRIVTEDEEQRRKSVNDIVEDRLNNFSQILAREAATVLDNHDSIVTTKDTDNKNSSRIAPQELVKHMTVRPINSKELDISRILDLVSSNDYDPGTDSSRSDNEEATRGRDESTAASKRNRTDSAGRLLRQLWRQFLKPIFKVELGVEKMERLVQRGNVRGEQNARQMDRIEKRMNELADKVDSTLATTNHNEPRCADLSETIRAAFRRVDGQFDNVEQRGLYQNSLAEKIYDRMRALSPTSSCPAGGETERSAAETTDESSDSGSVDASETANAEDDVFVTADELPIDCREVGDRGATESGVYAIRVDGKRLNVYCELSAKGGGWMTIQRRDLYPGEQENFSRTWQDYKIGFGDIQREFWLGNENIHAITSTKDFSLLVQLSDFEGNDAYAIYNKFRVDSEPDLYRLHLSGYSGNASDSLSAHNTKPFSTFDRPHDEVDPCCHCAPTFGGGWWFYACFEAHLNGPYLTKPTDNGYFGGIIWELWKGDYSLRRAVMHVRPADGNDKVTATTTSGGGNSNAHWPSITRTVRPVVDDDFEVQDP